MHKNNPKTFWVICLENLDHKLHGAVILMAESTKNRRFEGNQHTIFAMEKSVISKTMA